MITVERKDAVVRLHLKTEIDGAGEWTYYFDWTSGSKDYAQLLVNQFSLALEQQLKKIRKDAYDKGFSDAKAKRKRETWFSGWF
jgi:hypothetical protein